MALTYKISYTYTNDNHGYHANFGPSKQAAIAKARQLLTAHNLNGLFVFSYDESASDDFSDMIYFDREGTVTNHLNWVK